MRKDLDKLTALGRNVQAAGDYDPSVLDSFENQHPERDYWVTFTCPEFTTLCPKTGQPDFATLTIRYIPAKRLVESKSLKLYLFGFRNHGDFHEDVVNVVYDDIWKLLKPKYLEVYGKFAARGGITIDPFMNGGAGASYRAVADFAIPYGDFEEWEPAAGCTSLTNYPNVGDYNHAKGWALTSTDATLQGDKFPVFVATDAARLAKSTKLLSVRSNEKTGCSYLGFISNKGRAATEFTAPQGVWFLKAKIAHAKGYYGSTGYGSAFSLQATLTRADSSTVDLGTVTAAGVTFDEVVWPKGLVFAEPENVTLTLTPVNASIGVIDDLRLGFAGVNLVANGGFENGTTGWSTLVDKSVYNNASVGVRDVTSESQWHGREYGYCVYEGMKYLFVMNTATAYQDIDFPEPGYYRLSFAVRSRVSVEGIYGRNLLTFWQGGDDMGAITTNKIVQLHPNTMNFVEHSYLFYVPKKGVRRIGISGEGNPDQPVTSGNQCTSVVDAFSIVRALDVDADAVPSAPSKMRVSVAAGATLNLDFSGTLACGPVTLGGTTVYGLVNAQTYPQYITGVGSLQATNPGAVIIFR